MTTYKYITNTYDNYALECVDAYVEKLGCPNVVTIVEDRSIKTHWERRQIGEWLSTSANKGDEIVVYQATDLARSTCQTLELLMAATDRGVNIRFVKYDKVFEGKPENELCHLLDLLQSIENDYISRRTTDALARRKAAGLPLGRPKGKKNKSLKLDKHRKEIIHYLDLCISKASIAKLVGCHPQTLYDWIERNEVIDKKPRKPRGVHATQVEEQASAGERVTFEAETV